MELTKRWMLRPTLYLVYNMGLNKILYPKYLRMRSGLKSPEKNEPRFLGIGASVLTPPLHQFCEPIPSTKTFDVL